MTFACIASLLAASPAFAQTPNPLPTPPPSLQLSRPLPQQGYLPFDLALTAASSALTACEKLGYKMSVAFVDTDGVEKVIFRSESAGARTISSSFNKDFTSASLGRPSQG